MPIDEKKFARLKKRVEDFRAERDRATGQVDAAMHRLSEEFNCATVKDAQLLLRKLNKEADDAEAAYVAAEEAFVAKWGDHLDES